jgi:hypothetical protein
LEESDGLDDMLYPVSTKALAADNKRYGMKQWNVFDVVAKSWEAAPGRHCPSFSVEGFEESGNSLTEYVEAAVEQQKHSSQQFERMVEDEEQQENLRLTLKAHVDADGNISRGAFLSWRKSVYKDEIRDKQKQLRDVILVDQTLSLAGTSDERKHAVDDIVNAFVWKVQKEMTARQVAKRKFFARISRPSLSRAFFTWCVHFCRHSCPASLQEVCRPKTLNLRGRHAGSLLSGRLPWRHCRPPACSQSHYCHGMSVTRGVDSQPCGRSLWE